MILEPNNPYVLKLTKGLPFIPFDQLVDGHAYRGRCRNADTAIWVAQKKMFIHWRTKFSRVYTEYIDHCQSDTPYDAFIPVEDIGIVDLHTLKPEPPKPFDWIKNEQGTC